MSEEPSGLNETLFQKGQRNWSAMCMLEPVLSSMIDPATKDFRDIPQVDSIRNDPAFNGLYSTARNELRELGTPSVAVTPKRIIEYMINHSLGEIQACLPNHPELVEKILNYAQAQGIKPQLIKHQMRPSFLLPRGKLAPSEVDTSQEKGPANILDERLAKAIAVAPRVLFDQEGNLKPRGLLTTEKFLQEFEEFKLMHNEVANTSRPIAEEVHARNFVDSILADKSHSLHHSLREAILHAAKKLPPEKPAREANSLSDQVRASIERAIDAREVSR